MDFKIKIILLSVVVIQTLTLSYDQQLKIIPKGISNELNPYIANKQVSELIALAKVHTVAVINYADGGICSGVIVAENLVLTAAHCTQTTSEKIKIKFGDEIDNPRRTTAVEMIINDVDFKGSHNNKQKGTDTGDLALLFLKSKIPPGYAAVEILAETRGLGYKTPLFFSGFGSGSKLHGGIIYVTDPDFSETEFASSQALEESVCKGDSGGPAFKLENQRLFLVGISSRGNQECTFNVYTNNEKIAKFYKETQYNLSRNLMVAQKVNPNQD
jgi:hypothetical protein